MLYIRANIFANYKSDLIHYENLVIEWNNQKSCSHRIQGKIRFISLIWRTFYI